jgi:hypothetical protein
MRFAVILGVLLIALPLLIRLPYAEQFPDSESYEGLRQADISGYDSLYARPHYATLSDLLFGTIPPQLLLIILAAITLFALSFYYDNEAFILFFVASPIFITVYTKVHEAALGVTFIAVMAALISRKQYWAVLFIPLCFSLGFTIGVLATITCISVALIRNMPFVALGASFFALVSAVVMAIINPLSYTGIIVPAFPQFLGLFGTRNGITIFLLALGIIGFLVQYANERKSEQLISLLIIPCALFFENGAIIIAAFLAIYASKAWDFLTNRKWSFEEIRTLTLVLISCGILFTVIVVERERVALDTERVALTEFVTASYPTGTPVAAPQDVVPVLAYHGYPSSRPPYIEPSFTISTLRQEGYKLLVSADENPLYEHLPVVYRSTEYTIYEVPAY